MRLALAAGLALMIPVVHAHQPVMDMAPRWADGFGFQIRQVYFGSDELRFKGSEADNPLGIERYVDATWLEGVYTFDRSIRTTIKIPYLQQRRIRNNNGIPTSQSNSGLGDIIIGLPLKRYNNDGAMTENWGLTPSVRIPTGNHSGDFPLSDGSVDIGLSLSYSSETPSFYQLYDLYFWKQGSGRRDMQSGDVWGLDINLGLHPWHDNDTNAGLFTMWDVSVRHEDPPNAFNLTTATGGDRVQTGPVLVYYRNSFMARAEFKFLAYEHFDSFGSSRGNEFSLAIGYAF